MVAGAERAADRGGNPAAHGARRHHLRQHGERKHQRDRGQRLDAEPADIGGFGHRDQRGAEHRDRVGKREPQQRRQDRRRHRLFRGALSAGASSGASIVMRHREARSRAELDYGRHIMDRAKAGCHPGPCRGHQGRPHRSMVPCRGARREIEDVRRDGLEANFSARAARRRSRRRTVPAARLIEGEIMRFAEQKRELNGFVVAHGLDGRIERDAGIAAAATIGAGRDAADAADIEPCGRSRSPSLK